MPQIILSVNDTSLSLTSPINLIGTQANYTECVFNCNVGWDGLDKTAVFFSDTTEPQHVIFENTTCTIPWESLVNPGVLYIGLLGTSLDKVVPTNFVTLKITEGSGNNNAPLPPSIDVYSQIYAKVTQYTEAEEERVANDITRPIYLYKTQAAYDALPLEDKENPKYIYEITDNTDEIEEELQLFIGDIASNLENTYAPRLTQLEQQQDVLESTLSQDYKSIFSSATGKDTSLVEQNFNNKAEGQSDVKIEGLTLNNSVVNGDFTSITNWVLNNSSLTTLNNVLSVTADGTAVTGGVSQTTKILIASGKKVYIRGSLRVTNANCALMRLYGYGSTTTGTTQSIGTINTPVQNQWYNWSAIITIPSDALGNLVVKAIHQYSNTTTANGKVMEMKNIIATDLNALGLDTLTLEQLDFMADHYINGLQGIGSHKVVSVGKNRFDKITTVDKIIVQATSTYASRVVEEGFDCLKLVGNGSYLNKVLGSKFKPSTQYTFKFTVKNNGTQGGFIAIIYADGTTLTLNTGLSSFTTITLTSAIGKSISDLFLGYSNVGTTYYRLDDFQIVEGTTPLATYEPYQTSEVSVTLPRQLHRVPNGVADTMENINNVPQVMYRNMEYTLQASDITEIYSSSNIQRVSVPLSKLIGIIAQSSAVDDNNIIVKGFGGWVNQGEPESWDLSSSAYKLATSSTILYLFVPLTSYPTLADAQTGLTGTKVIYQLAIPIIYKNGENGFSQTGNLEVYNGGTIYIEPTVLKECTNPKTYITYNLSQKSVIVGNSGELTEIQKFISTRTIIESGSNANGYYAKFGDGTMICHHMVSQTSLAITNAIGSLYNSGNLTWTFPATFTDVNTKVFGDVIGANILGFIVDLGATASSIIYRVVNTTSQTTNVTIKLFAIGRWK